MIFFIDFHLVIVQFYYTCLYFIIDEIKKRVSILFYFLKNQRSILKKDGRMFIKVNDYQFTKKKPQNRLNLFHGILNRLIKLC
ncbi:MAG TPA: hypothetical protein DEQ57_06355 [Enterococcus sp.]|nr:hypothetical protein [Enterococcus sp.]